MSLSTRVYDAIEAVVIGLNPALPLTKPTGPEADAQLLPPPYHFVKPGLTGIEWIVVVAFLFVLCWGLTRGGEKDLWRVAIPHRSSPEGPNGIGRRLLKALDTVLRVVCLACCALTVWYKIVTDRKVYLLQPCHLSNFLLGLLCLYSPRRHHWARLLFYANLTTSYGTLIACLAPDTKSLRQPFEKEFFFTQHYMLLVLPCVWLIRRRAALYAGLKLDTYLWAVFALMHWLIFLPASLLRSGGNGIGPGANVNYMMMPPSVYPKAVPQSFYRPIVLLACLGLTWLTRYVIVEAVVRCFRVRAAAAKEQEEDAEFFLLKKPDGASSAIVSSTRQKSPVAAVRSRSKSSAAAKASLKALQTVDLSSSPVAVSSTKSLRPSSPSPSAANKKAAATPSRSKRAASPASSGTRGRK